MDAQEKRDFEAGFASAMKQIESGDSNCTVIETSAGGKGINAVIVVRGDASTFDVCQAVLAVMDRWEGKAEPVSQPKTCGHCTRPLADSDYTCVHGVCTECHSLKFCIGCGQRLAA